MPGFLNTHWWTTTDPLWSRTLLIHIRSQHWMNEWYLDIRPWMDVGIYSSSIHIPGIMKCVHWSNRRRYRRSLAARLMAPFLASRVDEWSQWMKLYSIVITFIHVSSSSTRYIYKYIWGCIKGCCDWLIDWFIKGVF